MKKKRRKKERKRKVFLSKIKRIKNRFMITKKTGEKSKGEKRKRKEKDYT